MIGLFDTKITIEEIPAGVTVLKDSVFRGCSQLKISYFKAPLAEIQPHALNRAALQSNLSEVSIDSSVTTIHPNAFGNSDKFAYGGPSVKSVYFGANWADYLESLGLENHEDIEDVDLMEQHVLGKMGFSAATTNPFFDQIINMG